MVSNLLSLYKIFCSGFATRAIYGGFRADPLHGGVTPAIDLSSTYAQTAPGQLSSCMDYSRCGNPTVLALQRNLACMEGSNYAFALNCGLSAVTACLSLLKKDDHLLTVDDVYGGTQRYLRKVFCPQTGIDWTMCDMTDFENFKKCFKKNTTMVWVESPTNPTLKCLDIKRIADFCKKRGALLVIDNTFMSPALQVSFSNPFFN